MSDYIPGFSMYIVNPSIPTNEIPCGDLRSTMRDYGRENVRILVTTHDKVTGNIQYRIYRRAGNRGWNCYSSCGCLLFSHLVPAIDSNRTSIFTDNNFTKKLYAGGE